MIKFDNPALCRNQIRCINVLRGHARVLSEECREEVTNRITSMGYPAGTINEVTEYLGKNAPIVIHFKPEIFIEKALTDGIYRNLFELHTGGGCTSENIRAQWESERFMRIYDKKEPFERPKYGSMNVLNHPQGTKPAQAYGVGYLVINDEVRIRCTMASGDTASKVCIGTPDYCLHVVKCFSDNELGSICQIVHNQIPYGEYRTETYREIQIHGELRFDRDISRIVVPEKYAVGAKKFADTYGVDYEVF